MKYIIIDGDVEFPLVQIADAEMDRLLNDPEFRNLKAFPCYYDSRGNYWPRFSGNYEILFK